MSEETEQALYMAAEYTTEEKRQTMGCIRRLAWIGAAVALAQIGLRLLRMFAPDSISWLGHGIDFLSGALVSLMMALAFIILIYTGAQNAKLCGMKKRIDRFWVKRETNRQ